MKRTVIERLDVGARLLAATPLSKTRPPQLHRHARSGSRLFCSSFMQQAVVAQQLQHDVRASIYTNAHGLVSSLESLASLMETDLGGMDSWVRRLDLAAAALQKGQRQRIAIIGDDLARPQDVVTALLQDPLIADSEYRTSLYDRHVGVVEEHLVISVSDAVERLPNALRLPSSWLYETGCDLLEVTSDTQEFSSDAIMVSDIILLVLDPYRLVTPQAQRLLDVLGGDDRLHVVVNGPASVLAKTQVEARLAQQAPSCRSLHYVDATAAQDAVTIFQASQSSASSIQPSAVEQFQSKFLNSRMNVLQAAIAQQAKSTPDYATRTPAILVQLALRQVRTTIGEERVSSQKAVDAVCSLEQAVQRKTSTIRHRSVAWRGIESGLVEGGVDHMMSGLRHQISAQFDTRWNWLNLVGKGRVDEVGREIRHHISAEFGRALDRQLIFESGKLAQIQEGISSGVDKTLRQFSGLQPANTAVLSNHLASLSVSIPTITPDCLTGPIEARRHQLLDTSASRLHRSAQRALGGTVSLSVLSAALSWASTLPSIELLSVDTAVGLAGLGIVGSFALGQRAWLKAQRRFWRDWDRVISMLRGDLQASRSSE